MQRVSLVLALVCAVLMSGCASGGGVPSARTSSSPSSATVPATPSVETSVAGSIPSLSFVAASTLPKGSSVKPGVKLAAGSYKPFLTGRDISSVRWASGERNGTKQVVLSLTLDATGREMFATWTKRHIGQNMLVLLDGTVLASPAFMEPITQGELALDSPGVLSARPQIDAATVAAP